MQSLKIDREVLNNSDPNYLTSLFHTTVTSILDEFAPFRSRKIIHAPNPWVTKELRAKCKARDSLYKRAKRNCNVDLLNLFKIKRNFFKIELASACENYLCNALSNILSGSNMWGKLKHLGLVIG